MLYRATQDQIVGRARFFVCRSCATPAGTVGARTAGRRIQSGVAPVLPGIAAAAWRRQLTTASAQPKIPLGKPEG